MKLGVSYVGSHMPAHIEMDFREIKSAGCDEVNVALSENDFYYLTGKVKLSPRIAHDQGLGAFANFWGYACTFGGGRISRLLTENPEVWQVSKEGVPIGEGCINNPLLIKRAQEMVDLCASCGYDGFYWDEPTRNNCYCKHCREKYEAKYREPIPSEKTENLSAFRTEAIVDYVRVMSDYVKKVDAKLKTGTCVMHTDKESWENVTKIKSLDIFGTDPYWICHKEALVPFVPKYSREAIDCAKKNGKESNIWVQCWIIPKGREHEVYEAAHLIAKENPDYLFSWCYLSAMGTSEASDDPLEAWKNLVKAYKEIKQMQSDRKSCNV